MFENTKLIIANHVTATQEVLDSAECAARAKYELALRVAFVEGESGVRLAVAAEIASAVTVARSGYPRATISDEVREIIGAAFRAGIFKGSKIGSVSIYSDFSGFHSVGAAEEWASVAADAYSVANDYRIRNGEK